VCGVGRVATKREEKRDSSDMEKTPNRGFQTQKSGGVECRVSVEDTARSGTKAAACSRLEREGLGEGGGVSEGEKPGGGKDVGQSG